MGGIHFPIMQLFTSPPEDETQESTPQLDHQHGRLLPTEHGGPKCGECGEGFESKDALHQHLYISSHKGFICLCGSGFTRSDALYRHIKSNSKDKPKWCCTRPGCKNRDSGRNGFPRKDHLLQHLIGYHKENQELQGRLLPTCPHLDCDKYRRPSFHLQPRQGQIKDKPFENRTHYNKHMRRVHRESPFACRVPACSARFPTATALTTHFRSEHPSLQQFPNWDGPLELCPFPDCEVLFPPTDGQKHVRKAHSANVCHP